ncbi:alpha/beta fold hydrolase [Streptomyces sp. NPDC051218]|uniref:alpha/beta fold hydrolase n=1 Tax=Streptomyces sp. NPDC051218 TaxID=3365645 RepID=UPI0037BBA338
MAHQAELNTRVDITAVLRRITTPTLLVSGSQGLIVPPHHQRELADTRTPRAHRTLDTADAPVG